MNPVEYVFRISEFTPETLPMGRLAEYLAALAKLIGHEERTHFVAVEPGSARLRHKVEVVDAPKVAARLDSVRIGDGPKDAMAAVKTLEQLLANDNALGALTEAETGRVVVPFTGRNRPKRIVFPPFRENATIDGQIVKIGGKDSTAHATLQDGDIFHTNVSMKRELARELAPLLYGAWVRLHGNGRFERQEDGVWRMLDFQVERYEPLDSRPISEVLATVRQAPSNGLMKSDAYAAVSALRDGGEDGQ